MDAADHNGPQWPIRLDPDSGTPRPDLRHLIISRAQGSWYVGAAVALVWLVSLAPEIVRAAAGATSAALGIALLVAYGLGFLLAVPLSWWIPQRWRLLPATGLFALSFTLYPWLGWGVRSTWAYVGVAVGMAVVAFPLTCMLLLALSGLAVLAGAALLGWGEEIWWLPAIIASVSAMMAAFTRNIAAMNELRATRHEMAAMAVDRERTRLARDIHDILGHSLTVITVKAELAGRLVAVDPDRARTEIAEAEALSRGALADVRATVAGYRGVSVSNELAAARGALDAAGIAADLPRSVDTLPAEYRELAGWVVREGVTNVVRHAAASRCRIRITADEVTIEDDGVGAASAVARSGTGLLGLRERVEAGGARLDLGGSDLGGFRLAVQL